jgi:hypothetical protein
MAFFLKFGSVNKKFLMPIIASILYIIMDIIEYNTEMKELHTILDLYSRGISYSLIIIIPKLLNSFDKNKESEKKECNITKKTILHYFLLYLNYILYFVVYGYITHLKSKGKSQGDNPKDYEDFELSHYKGFCTEESVEIILIVIVSKFLLKTKLYIHHFIGLIIFVVFSLIIDIVFEISMLKTGFYFFFVYLIFIFLDSLFITYEKYMMDKLYYSPYHIIFGIGLLFLACSTCVVILIFIFGSMMYDGTKYKLPAFPLYFQDNPYENVILHMVYLTTFRFFLNILKILTIYYFTQNHIYTTYIIIKLFHLLLHKNNVGNKKYFTLILFIFQFLGLLIYIEVIELNFWHLNENTKNAIKEREKIDQVMAEEKSNEEVKRESTSSLSDIDDDYITKKVNENNENQILLQTLN